MTRVKSQGQPKKKKKTVKKKRSNWPDVVFFFYQQPVDSGVNMSAILPYMPNDGLINVAPDFGVRMTPLTMNMMMMTQSSLTQYLTEIKMVMTIHAP